jgi:hypothetical protein
VCNVYMHSTAACRGATLLTVHQPVDPGRTMSESGGIARLHSGGRLREIFLMKCAQAKLSGNGWRTLHGRSCYQALMAIVRSMLSTATAIGVTSCLHVGCSAGILGFIVSGQVQLRKLHPVKQPGRNTLDMHVKAQCDSAHTHTHRMLEISLYIPARLAHIGFTHC